MAYFSQDFIDFFTQLELNNNRDWFNENKSTFKKKVEAPFLSFLGAVIEQFQKYDPRIILTPKDAVFRIYRDVRFSQDKSPYKNHMGAVVAPGGKKGKMLGGAYLELSGHHARIYGGVYMPEKTDLQNLRDYLAAHPDEFEALLRDQAFQKYYGTIHGEKNKRLPKEMDEAAARQPLLFNKSFYFFHEWPAKAILKEDFLHALIDAYLAGKPMSDFLAEGAQGNQ